MKGYYRLMLGRNSAYAAECFDGGFVGTDFGIRQDLKDQFPEQWREFNRDYIPVYLAAHPDRSKIAAGLACAAIWNVSKGMKIGDFVLSPDGSGRYHVGEVSGDYYYAGDGVVAPSSPCELVIAVHR